MTGDSKEVRQTPEISSGIPAKWTLELQSVARIVIGFLVFRHGMRRDARHRPGQTPLRNHDDTELKSVLLHSHERRAAVPRARASLGRCDRAAARHPQLARLARPIAAPSHPHFVAHRTVARRTLAASVPRADGYGRLADWVGSTPFKPTLAQARSTWVSLE